MVLNGVLSGGLGQLSGAGHTDLLSSQVSHDVCQGKL